MFSSNQTQYHLLDVKQIWSASLNHRIEGTGEHRLYFFFRGCESDITVNGKSMDIDNLTLLFVPKGSTCTHKATREKTIRIHFETTG